jgi:FMN-dependent NADH-azoreductase
MTAILHLDSSARTEDSLTRAASSLYVKQLSDAASQSRVTYRNLYDTTPLLNAEMVTSYFTAPHERTADQRRVIEASDRVVQDLKDHDVYVIGLPMYNFSMPAAFKAWADLAARVGETFQYTEDGPVGLLENKRVIILVSTGGTSLGSEIDFLTPWVRQFFRFIGVENCEILAANEVLSGQPAEQQAA